MLIVCWSPKGGSGTTTVAAALALTLADRPLNSRAPDPIRLVDLAGDQAATLGVAPAPPGVVGGPGAGGLTAWLAAGPAAPTEALDACGREVAPGLVLLDGSDTPGVPVTSTSAEAGAALGVALRDDRSVVVDAGRAETAHARALVEVADVSVMVVRPCYVALRRALADPLTGLAAGVVLVDEPARALSAADVSEVLGLPVLVRVPLRPAIARAVDAGVLAARVPPDLGSAAEALASACLMAARSGRSGWAA